MTENINLHTQTNPILLSDLTSQRIKSQTACLLFCFVCGLTGHTHFALFLTIFFVLFRISGIIRVATSNMDRETRERYTVVVQAKDMAGSVGGLSGSTTVSITLSDVNDQPPKFSQSEWSLRCSCSAGAA